MSRYAKKFKPCLCGCGRKVRQYPCRPKKYFSRACYLSHFKYLMALEVKKLAQNYN